MSPARERLAYAAVGLLIIGAGLWRRWSRLGLPWPVAKYAGSALWGAMLYAVLRDTAAGADRKRRDGRSRDSGRG